MQKESLIVLNLRRERFFMFTIKKLEGNRFTYYALDKLQNLFETRDITEVSTGIVLMFCYNFANTDTGVVSWAGKEKYYPGMVATDNLAMAVSACTGLQKAACYFALKKLLTYNFLTKNDQGDYVLLDPEFSKSSTGNNKHTTNGYFRVPFVLFTTTVLKDLARARELQYLIALLTMFKEISQHMAGLGAIVAQKKPLELVYSTKRLKIMLTNPRALAQGKLVRVSTVRTVFGGYFAPIFNYKWTHRPITSSSGFLDKYLASIRFKIKAECLTATDYAAKREELNAFAEHLSLTKQDYEFINNDYELNQIKRTFVTQFASLYDTRFSPNQSNLLAFLKKALHTKSTKQTRTSFFNQCALQMSAQLARVTEKPRDLISWVTKVSSDAINNTFHLLLSKVAPTDRDFNVTNKVIAIEEAFVETSPRNYVLKQRRLRREDLDS